MYRRTVLGAFAALGTIVAAAAAPASAADYSGKSITFIIPFAVAGGSDVWGRYIAPYIGKHLPGSPTVTVRNQPGGGSITGANVFAAMAKPDGLTILGTSGSTQFPYLLGVPQVKYEYKDWKVALAGPTGGVAYLSSKLGVKSLKDLGQLKGRKIHYASQGLTSLDLVPLLGFRLLGLDVQHVTGFPGRGEGRLAFERGESTIDYQTSSAYIRSSLPLVKRGEAVPLFSWGVLDETGKLIRDPNFKDLPHFEEAYEMVHGKQPSGVEWEVMRLFLVAGFPAQKLVLLPKGTPDEIVEDYRGAMRKMLRDPDYLAKHDEIIGEYGQVTDKAAETLFKSAISVTPQARTWVRDLLTKEYNASFDK